MRNKNVVDSFLRRQIAHTINLYSTGDKLFSYSTVIAQYIGDYDNPTLVGNATKYSVTTSRHMSYVKDSIDIYTTKYVPRGTNNLIPYI